MNEKRQAGLAMGGMCMVMALSDALSPPVARPDGKLSFIFGTAYDAMGAWGPAMVWGICAAVFLLVALGPRSDRSAGRK